MISELFIIKLFQQIRRFVPLHRIIFNIYRFHMSLFLKRLRPADVS